MHKWIRGAMRILHLASPTYGKIYKKYNAAVVVAAGSGTRMQSAQTKQTMDLCGVPVIVRTLRAFEMSRAIREIVVVARAEEMNLYREWKQVYGLTKLTRVVRGGETRQESCRLGFAALGDRADYVALHDGARCLVTVQNIEDTLRCAYIHDCAAAACPATDTVKQCDDYAGVQTTLDRDHIWMAQTPQVFRADIYRAVSEQAKEDGFCATDDCALAEHYHFPVYLTDCGRQNIKITTAEDLCIAKAILQLRADAERNEASK